MKKRVVGGLGLAFWVMASVGVLAAEETQETEALQKLYDAHVVRTILANHQNVRRNTILWNAQGEVTYSFFEYQDGDTYVSEDSNSYVFIQKKDGYYEYDPANPGPIVVCFGMEGVLEAEWESRLDANLGLEATEGEEVTAVTETDGLLYVTLEADAESEKENYESFAQVIETGDRLVSEITADPKTCETLEAKVYLDKTDGTRMTVMENYFSYDAAVYEPSEEMQKCMDGTDRTITLIADPDTEKEKTYTKSCGENGVFAPWLAEGYENLYLDRACTEVLTESDGADELLYYAAEGR